MRPIALLAMMLAWLVYGGLAAWAGCPFCVQGTAHGAFASAGGHHEHGGGHSIAAPEPKAKAADPCLAGAAHMTNCAACLALPPMLAQDVPLLRHAYPAPEAGLALADLRPAPLSPPPRSL